MAQCFNSLWLISKPVLITGNTVVFVVFLLWLACGLALFCRYFCETKCFICGWPSSSPFHLRQLVGQSHIGSPQVIQQSSFSVHQKLLSTASDVVIFSYWLTCSRCHMTSSWPAFIPGTFWGRIPPANFQFPFPKPLPNRVLWSFFRSGQWVTNISRKLSFSGQ